MKGLLAAILMLCAAVPSVTPAWAHPHPAGSAPVSSPAVFRLSVDGAIAPTDTFWVAYGPLAGKWGIIQMHASGPRLYVARASLPRGRTVFSYIQGRGTMRTRLGVVPGNPVTTIRQFGPTSASGTVFPLIVWHEPLG